MSPIEEIKQKLDIVEIVGSYIKLQKAGSNYKALCPFHSEKTPSLFVSPSKQIWHCFGCLLPNSLVKTERGFHRIEDLQRGEKVLTHTGRYMPIIRALWRPYKGEIFDIRVKKSNKTVSLTADHEVFCIKAKECIYKTRFVQICQGGCKKKNCPRFYLDYKVEKVTANKLSKDDLLLYPINQEIRDIEFIDLEKHYNTNFGNDIAKIPTKIRVDDKFLKLIGYYIIRGSSRQAYIRFSLAKSEGKFVREIKNLTKEIFGIEVNIRKRKNKEKTGLEISLCNSKLSNIFENLCGKTTEDKHIPFELQYLPPKKQRIILDAIWKGGRSKSRVNGAKKERYYTIETTSLTLAEQLRDILLRLGIAPGFYEKKKKADKNTFYHKKFYRIEWKESNEYHFSSFYKDPENGVLYWALPIKEIKKRDYKGDTYDLTVAGDHSYVVTNFAVSNCGRGGDIFAFVKEIEGVEFGDALKILAQKAGVELKPFNPEWKTERQRLIEICELSRKFFEIQLQKSKTGKEAKEYLLKRGITEDSILEWNLGYSPDLPNALFNFLKNKGFKEEEIEKTGLVIKKGNTYLDRFRGRIIFPIFDLNSQTIGFGGRVFKERNKPDIAKYLNIPNTPLYDKSKILYGLNKARLKIREKDFCLVVEGYIDTIMAYQSGSENVVGCCGTALTPYQLKTLKRYTNNLWLCFDVDVAGENATKRGIDLALKEEFNIKVVEIKEGKDPAELILENEKEWQEILKKPTSIAEFYFNTAFKKANPNTPEGKKRISEIILPFLKRMPNKIERAYWIQKLADELEIKEDDIREELKKIKLLDDYIFPKVKEETSPPPKKSRKELLEERIVTLVFKEPSTINLIEDLTIFSESIKNILEALKENKSLDNPQFNYFSLKAEIEEIPKETIPRELKFCLRELKTLKIKDYLHQLSLEIKKAEEEGDFEKVKELTKKFNQIIYYECKNNKGQAPKT